MGPVHWLTGNMFEPRRTVASRSNNPVRTLKGDGDIRDLLRSTHDPKRVPFLKHKEDVAAVFQALPRSINIVYALGALAGLRPGEAVALE